MKKLTLNKETIANLNTNQAMRIFGGDVPPAVSGFSQIDPKCLTDCDEIQTCLSCDNTHCAVMSCVYSGCLPETCFGCPTDAC